MDERDYRVVLELTRNPFASCEAIGREVGMTGTAVRARVDSMEARGVLNGYHVLPSPRVFGRWRHIFAYRDVAPEPSLTTLLGMENAVAVFRGSPGMIMVNTYDLEVDAGPPAALVKLIGRAPDGAVLTDDPGEGRPPNLVLSPLDWRVIAALLDDPRAPLAELARATRLTARTVRKRRDDLVRKGLLHVSPIVDTSREPGLIVFSGYVMVERKSDLERIQAPGLGWVWTHHDPPAAAFFGRAATYGEVQETQRSLQSIRGVLHVDLTVARGGGIASRRLHRWIRAELKPWNRSRKRRDA